MDGFGAGACAGGLARAKTFIQQERHKGEPMLVLNAGDDFIGTLWDHHFKGRASAHFLNQLGIDALVSTDKAAIFHVKWVLTGNQGQHGLWLSLGLFDDVKLAAVESSAGN